MAKYVHPTEVTDALLNAIKNNVTRLSIATAACTTYANATALAVGTLARTSTDFTVGAGDAGGARKVTMAAATVTVGTSGTVDHICLYGTAGSGTLFIAGTCAPTSVTSSGTVVISAWDVDEVGTIT